MIIRIWSLKVFKSFWLPRPAEQGQNHRFRPFHEIPRRNSASAPPERLVVYAGHERVHTLDLPAENQSTDGEINRISLADERARRVRERIPGRWRFQSITAESVADSGRRTWLFCAPGDPPEFEN